MHELSIVMSIVDLAEKQVQQAGASQVESIELEIGELAGIEMQALDFAWSSAVRHTVLENAERIILSVNGKARCLECEREYEMHTLYEQCPRCQSFFSDILQGKELRVKALTVSS